MKQKKFSLGRLIVSVLLGSIFGLLGGVLAFFLTFDFLIKGDTFNLLERITERTVYVEESALIDMNEKVADSVVGIIAQADYEKFLRTGAVSEEQCLKLFAPDECRYDLKQAIILSGDGLVVSAAREEINWGEYFLLLNGNTYAIELVDTNTRHGLVYLNILENEQEFEVLTYKPIGFGNLDDLISGQKVVELVYTGAENSFILAQNLIIGVGEPHLQGIIDADSTYAGFELDLPKFTSSALLNMGGQLIGLIVDEEIVSANIIKSDLAKLQSKKSLQVLDWGMNYVMIDKELKSLLGFEINSGAYLISGLQKDEPIFEAVTKDEIANALGLLSGDVIVEIDGQVIFDRNQFSRILRLKSKGERISMKVYREGEVVKIEGII